MSHKQAPRVLFYVQHLLGVGHIKRASLLVRGWCEEGLDVCVVSGGVPLVQFDFAPAALIQLPPVKAADSAFSALVTEDGQPLDAAFRQRRSQQLLAAFAQQQPDILVLENFPFGRRQLRWELMPLLEAAHGRQRRPLIACSVRDIVQRRRPERRTETLALVQRYFDAVLVHGDSRFVPLDISFPEADRIREWLFYTGYVTAPASTHDRSPRVDEVVVSAGGGAVGFRLLQTALNCRHHTRLAGATWRLLVGPNLPMAQVAELRALAGPGVIIEPNRSDFSDLLRHCRLSISQGGYNTLMDLLGADVPAVVVPFEGQGETEQLERCTRLAQLGGCVALREQALSPAALAAVVDRALGLTPARLEIDLDGAHHSGRLLRRLWECPLG